MFFKEISFHLFILVSLRLKLTSTSREFYLIETSDKTREHGNDYTESDQTEEKGKLCDQFTHRDYVALSYTYGFEIKHGAGCNDNQGNDYNDYMFGKIPYF